MHYLENFDTSLKAVGSVPDGVFGIFYLLNTSYITMGLRSAQPRKRSDYGVYLMMVKAAAG